MEAVARLRKRRAQDVVAHERLKARTERARQRGTRPGDHARTLALQRGYATNFGESEQEIGSIGVAVHDVHGGLRAGLAVSGPLSRVNETREAEVTAIIAALRQAAKDAAATLV